MNFIIATQTEIIKTKRTAAFWLSLCGAAFIPAIFFIMCSFVEEKPVKDFLATPWKTFFTAGWQILSAFLLPMYIILICALIPQIEYKNNAWKQVFASPQSTGQIFFSKFLTVHLMILLCYILFNSLMILSGISINLIKPGYTFLQHELDWSLIMQLNARTYISLLGISAIQFWLSLRFKNFIAPMGIGLALLVCAIVALGFHWKHVYKLPHAFPALTFMSIEKKGSMSLENHELNSIGYFIVFTLMGYFDLLLRKEKG
jgi:hypothetical protein